MDNVAEVVGFAWFEADVAGGVVDIVGALWSVFGGQTVPDGTEC